MARIKEFHTTISIGPTFSCKVCDMLCYKKSISVITNCIIPENNASKKCFANDNDSMYICNTYKRHIKANSIPPMATVNGLKFPSVANELIGLHHLEWRLLSPRIPFMKIYAAPRGGQKKIKGNVVNVVSNTQGTYTKLSKMSNDQDTIAVKLKRNLRYDKL